MTKDNSTKRHTPTPWLLKGNLTITKCGSMTKLDHVICNVKNQLSGFDLAGERLEQEANARLIVSAVNMHEELVEALKELYNEVFNTYPLVHKDGHWTYVMEKANKALSTAERIE